MNITKNNILILFDFLFKSDLNKLLFFAILSSAIFYYNYNFGMFWDNVLFASKMGNHLYNTNLFNWILPDSIDPGHPPAFGFLMALSWKIFGHKLWVSHLVMIPFSAGLLYQIYKLIKYYVKSNFHAFLALVLIFADPTLATQMLIVNPELIMLFFFFLAINSILFKNYYLKIIALFFLSIISLRSMMLCGGVFLFEIFNSLLINKNKKLLFLNPKFILGYAFASLPGIYFLVSHFISKGWLLTHPNSPWEAHHHYVTLNQFLRNIVVLIHRFLDFGRIFIFIFLSIAFIKYYKKIIAEKYNRQLLLLAVTSLVIIVTASLLKTNPFGHRYFIAGYIFITLLAFKILEIFFRKRKLIYSILLLGLITGNLWIYPREISQGWDATLAHLPYYELRSEAISYLDKNDIKIENTASFSPNSTKIDDVDLSGDLRSFSNFSGNEEFIFYSNVYNLTDEQYDSIDNNYEIIKQFQKFNIHIYIYKKK